MKGEKMAKRKKLNKLKVSIVIILIILIFTTTVFGRYIYNSVREAYLSAKEFYFSSNILTVNGSEYQYNNWGGVDVYPIEFDLYSYNNKFSKLDYDLDYTVTCSTSDTDKIKCTINSYDENATNTANGTIYATTNTSRVVVFVTPLATINRNDSVKVQVTASTSIPYEKTIYCEFTLKIETQGENTYSIEDVANRDYAILQLVNANDTATSVTLEFDPSELRLDLNDEVYLNNKENVTLDGNQYVKKIVFNLDAETTKNVKFYKVDKSQNYTYPGINGTSAINVTI